ncbi:hypothetical protein Shyhy01_15520 [Streptomyces hygroscopicus subsp. hygroscopicus]|nr:hypothetical protein Shyhy01_15520 [Streptomyces hygroscopicus subsp. hygroscopicus]
MRDARVPGVPEHGPGSLVVDLDGPVIGRILPGGRRGASPAAGRVESASALWVVRTTGSPASAWASRPGAAARASVGVSHVTDAERSRAADAERRPGPWPLVTPTP